MTERLVAAYVGARLFLGLAPRGEPLAWPNCLEEAIELIVIRKQQPDGSLSSQILVAPIAPKRGPTTVYISPDAVMRVDGEEEMVALWSQVTGRAVIHKARPSLVIPS